MHKVRETKTYGSIRKSKIYGTCGVILGLAALSMISPVMADERTENKATNAPYAQTSPSSISTENQGKSEEKTGTLEVSISHSSLDETIRKAQEAGLKVEFDSVVDKGTASTASELEKKQKEVESDYRTQTDSIEKATEKYREDQRQNQTNRKKIQDENTAKKEQYQKDLASYQAEVNRINQKNAAIRAENEKNQRENQAETDRINQENAEIRKRNEAKRVTYESSLTDYTKKLAAIKAEREAIQTSKPLFGSETGFKVYGGYNSAGRGSLDYYNDFTVVPDDNLPVESMRGFLGYHADTYVTGGTGTRVSKDSTGTYDVIKSPTFGDTFYIHNIGTLTDGRKIMAKVMVSDLGDYQGEVRNGVPVTDPDIYLKGGDGGSLYFVYNNHTRLELIFDFYLEGTTTPVSLLIGTVITDVDWGQGSNLSYGSSGRGMVLNPSGSDLDFDGRVMKGVEDAVAYSDIPRGSFASVGYGSSLTYLHTSSPGSTAGRTPQEWDYVNANGNNQSVVFTILGEGTELKKIPFLTKPFEPTYEKEITPPSSPTGKTEEVLPPKPEEPKEKEIPSLMSPPTVRVRYARLQAMPGLEKFVKNSSGESIDKSYVPKLSTVQWELTTKPLPANREATTDFEIVDALPSGFVLDVEASKKVSSDFELTYDESNHVVRVKGLESLKSKLNQDLSKEVQVPAPILVGKVTNDGATYKNNFQLKINNKYESYSNIVQVSTPGKPNDPDNPNNNLIQPIKHNHNKDKVIIDGKPVLAGSTNYYHITLDYDQYKGMKADSSTILKGFGAIDDYPEEAVTINQSDIRYIDSEGQEVAGISVYQYDSIDAVDNDKVKAFLASSEIKPKGAFQVFLVDDPEAYFNQYIKSGKSVTIIDPMLTKEELRNTGKSFENTAYQVDFGNGYQTDTVVNNVPTAKPTKKNLNKAGVNIDGKQVLAGSVNYYTVTADYSQYKGIEADKDSIGKGFYIVDDYPEEAVTINQDGVQVTDSKGQVVKGLKMALYESLDKAPTGVQEAMKSRNFTPKGAIQVFEAENPEEFYKTYVQAGEVLTITNPMTVKKELGQTGGKYENTAYQLDFGSAYVTETVVNNVPTAKPTKKNLNKAGVNIDGKQVLAGSVNYYKVTADYSQYKGIEADKDRIGKGFYIVDDYPEEAVTINQDGVQVTDSKGQVVKGLKMALYESLDKAPTGVQEALKSSNFTPKGAIQVFEAENPEEFYKTYVQAGEVLTITNPMTVKKELGQTGGKYENTAYQIDFGMAYVTETVVNNVPKIEPKKDVVIDHLSKESLDGKELKLNQTFNYKLVGSLIPKDRSEQLFEYQFSDDYDETHDEYQGVYQVFATVDFETSDGQKFKAGDELTKFTSQVVDKAKGKVDISFDDAFLKSILGTLEFQAEVYLQMTRIQSGTVENTYSHTVNGVEVVSNTVVTHTPEEVKPEQPKKEEPKEEVSKAELPNTGMSSSNNLALLGMAMGTIALALSMRKKKE
ncbi:SspB-related isopeptide-forming adhesin [Streptococcus pseudopneumoniae]|uniref:SspB-related isopeptide-forming adhesin n=2 Tax=Streptococcus TaxID=1301 RepID=UPI0005DF801B|nr:SspB-related isopeptide-forming adhesin [Streptococcus pseudopneumoniae]CIP00516.1 agglutinin receptor [Streptococcus pseudopneumoniae]